MLFLLTVMEILCMHGTIAASAVLQFHIFRSSLVVLNVNHISHFNELVEKVFGRAVETKSY